MKKTIITSALLFIFFTVAHAQIPNSSFESWTTVGSYANPDGWDNFNALTAQSSVYTCEKGTTGAPHGSSFIMLTTKTVAGTAVPGLAICGTYDAATQKPKSGFPYAGRPLALTGKWQYMASGADKGRIAVYLTKWNTTTNTRDMVGSVEYDLPGMVMSWASFSIPITYLSGAMPDSAIIGLVSSNKSTTAVAGSYLYVDSLNFSGIAPNTIPLAINTNYNIALLPNPAKNKLTVDFGTVVMNNVKLCITDIYGTVVKDAAFPSGRRAYAMNLETLTPGMYFVKMNVGEDILTQRLVIE